MFSGFCCVVIEKELTNACIPLHCDKFLSLACSPCDVWPPVWIYLPLAITSEHDTTPSDCSDTMMFIAHDLSAVEEEHSTDVQSDKEAHFLSTMFVVRDYQDNNKSIVFKYGEIVEVLDTQRDDKWLVRKKVDSLQVGWLLQLISHLPHTFIFLLLCSPFVKKVLW